MGCGIDENKKITKLDCVHFICSDQCVAKLKKETKSGKTIKLKIEVMSITGVCKYSKNIKMCSKLILIFVIYRVEA